MDHAGFRDRFVLRFVGGVAFLPEKLRGAQKQAWPHFPTHHVRPLVNQKRQIAVRFDPARKRRADDRLRSRPDHVRLRQFAGGNHLGLARDRIFHGLESVVRDHGALGGEPFRVFRLFFQIGEGNQQREVGVLVARRLEAAVQLLLDQLPDAVAPWLDHHAAARFRILGEVGGFDDLLIPLGEILGAGRGDGGLFGGHGAAAIGIMPQRKEHQKFRVIADFWSARPQSPTQPRVSDLKWSGVSVENPELEV